MLNNNCENLKKKQKQYKTIAYTVYIKFMEHIYV